MVYALFLAEPEAFRRIEDESTGNRRPLKQSFCLSSSEKKQPLPLPLQRPSPFPPLLSTSTIPSLSLSDHCRTFHHFSSFSDFLRQTLLLVLKIQLCISITSYSKMCRGRGRRDRAARKRVFIGGGGAGLQLTLPPAPHCRHWECQCTQVVTSVGEGVIVVVGHRCGSYYSPLPTHASSSSGEHRGCGPAAPSSSCRGPAEDCVPHWWRGYLTVASSSWLAAHGSCGSRRLALVEHHRSSYATTRGKGRGWGWQRDNSNARRRWHGQGGGGVGRKIGPGHRDEGRPALAVPMS